MRRYPKCPKCQSENTIPIGYGLPTSEAEEEAREGKVILGGCCITPDSLRWHCPDCEHEWVGRSRKKEEWE